MKKVLSIVVSYQLCVNDYKRIKNHVELTLTSNKKLVMENKRILTKHLDVRYELERFLDKQKETDKDQLYYTFQR